MMVLPRRDQRQLAEQISVVIDFLSDGRDTDDALATCSPGWRPRNWRPSEGPCTAKDCKAEHDHSPHPRESPKWQSEIDRAVDRWPRYVVLGVPRAVNALPVMDRLIVRGKTAMGLSFRKVGEMVGLTHPTVRAHYDAALIAVAEAVWSDSGEPIW